MGYPSYIEQMYKDQMEAYKTYGEDLTYCGNKISTMGDDEIKKVIYDMYDHSVYFNIQTKGWLEIFKDILNKRKFNKLKKIISNIDG